MSLNSTPSAERIHIGFFGKRNVGKSSLINAITNQNISIVSDVKGTTTDPVSKAMELLPIGPILIIDTPGFDDEGTLGALRVKKTQQILNKVDIAILVVDAKTGITQEDKDILEIIKEKNIEYIIIYNKCDLLNEINQNNKEIYVSAKNSININNIKESIIALKNKIKKEKNIVKDLVSPKDIAILVTPIDESAPKGRLILPQQQVIRELLEENVITMIVQDTELKQTIKSLNTKPKIVITDSQVFKKVEKETPTNINLTSFSILFARYKGVLEQSKRGAKHLKYLKDNDTILISEGCTHHRQCNDIGSVKLPKWIQEYTEKTLNFEFSSGIEFPQDLSKYSLIIHCGGCMLNDREVLNRYKLAEKANVPISNYGIIISEIQGILDRSTYFLEK